MSTRDMARLGYLYLNNGTWDGEQIVSSEWVKDSSQPAWNLGGGWGYGYLWWLRTNLNFYSARGRYEQEIYVLPDQDIVVAITSNIAPGTYNPDYIIEEYIIPAITDEASYPFMFVSFVGLAILAKSLSRLQKSKRNVKS